MVTLRFIGFGHIYAFERKITKRKPGPFSTIAGYQYLFWRGVGCWPIKWTDTRPEPGNDRLSSSFSGQTDVMMLRSFSHKASNHVLLTTMILIVYNNIMLYCVCVCVCVCFLPIHSGHRVHWTYQPGSHRRTVTQDSSSTFLLRCMPLFFSREGFSHSFPSSTVKSNFVY